MSKNGLKSLWTRLDGERQWHLEEGRRNAEMVDWTILPPENADQNTRAAERYQSVAPRGVDRLAGLMTNAMIPHGLNWLAQDIPPEVAFDPGIPEEVKTKLRLQSHIEARVIQGNLEQAYLEADDNAGSDGFHTAMLREIRQLIVTGDTLTLVADDLRKHLYRNDQYVTLRNGRLEVVCHVIREVADVLSLDKEWVATNDLSEIASLDKPIETRQKELYTKVEWNPRENHWDITQEFDGKEYQPGKMTREVSPYICVSTSLAPGSSYGRAFMTNIASDVTTLDALSQAALECAAVCADVKWVIDASSQAREMDLMKKPLSVIRANVRGGQIQDIGVLQGQVSSGFNVIRELIEMKRAEVGYFFMLTNEMVRQSERTTATEVLQLQKQLDEHLGGLYTPIADMMLRPLAYIARDILIKKKKLPAYTAEQKRMTPPKIVTGAAALVRRNKLDSLVSLQRLATEMGEGALRYINTKKILDEVTKQLALDDLQVVKSDEQVAQEDQAAQQARVAEQSAIAANQQAASTAGAVTEQVALQQLAPGA
jgi:hypothetical protein